MCYLLPRLILLTIASVLLSSAETITVTKSLVGGGVPVGVVTVDGSQSFGVESPTFRASVSPGAHRLVSDLPTGYVVAYSTCVNCTNHPNSSFVNSTTAVVIVPLNGFVDVVWLYSPPPGLIQGARTLSDGSAYTGASISVDSAAAVPSGGSSFSVSAAASLHTVASSTPAGYSVSYSLCTNCTQHPLASFIPGATASVLVPSAGFVDILFIYTVTGATSLSVLSPASNQTLTGIATLSVTGTNLSKVASVEYSIGSNRIAKVLAQSGNPTFLANWNSALASDGASQIETTARDDLDNILFQDFRPVILNNYGNAATAPLPSQLTGSVPVTLNVYDRLRYPAYWQIFFDGEIAPGSSGLLFTDHDGVHTNSRTTVLDTTIYSNGRHEFHFAFHSNNYPSNVTSGAGYDFRGMVTQNVNINNGRALMEILPNYLFVYAPVSTGVQLTCGRAYTNGDRDSCAAPSYSVDSTNSSPGIQVSSTGLVSSLSEGYGDILVSDAGKSATVHVWIRNTPGLPHFQDAGRYGSAYLAGKSLFSVAPFQLSPDILVSNSTALAETKRAGVNTLNKGIYLPNSNISLPFATWKQSFDASFYASAWSWSVANGFRVLGSGDDIARRPGWEAMWMSAWPAARQAVQYAMQTFATSGAGLSLDVVDESSAIWGPNPTPAGLLGTANAPLSATCSGTLCSFTWPSLTDPLDYTFHDFLSLGRTFLIGGTSGLSTPPGRANIITGIAGTQIAFTSPNAFSNGTTFNTGNSPTLDFFWFSGANSCDGNVTCNPSLTNQVLANITSWLRTAPAKVPVSWPPAGAALPYVHKNWVRVGGISDFPSHYWDTNQQRRTYSFGMGVRENQNSMLTAFLGRQTFLDVNRPQFLQQSMTGISYQKFSAAGVSVYSPPVDQLLHVGQTPRAVSSGIIVAAAAGAAGVKLYKFDTTFTQRRDNTGDGTEFESDAGPTTGEVLSWQAMGYAAAALTKPLQEYLLGNPVSSPYLGRNIISGARSSAKGNLLLVVNGWDAARTVPLDFTGFRTGRSILRYRVGEAWLKTSALGDVASDTVTLAAGEAALYLFPNTALASVDTVTFQPDTASVKTILRTNYLYGQNTAAYGAPINCTGGCTVTVDRSVGEAYYSYAVLDATDSVQCRSAPILIPAGTSVPLPVAPQTRGAVCQ